MWIQQKNHHQQQHQQHHHQQHQHQQQSLTTFTWCDVARTTASHGILSSLVRYRISPTLEVRKHICLFLNQLCDMECKNNQIMGYKGGIMKLPNSQKLEYQKRN